MIVQEQKTFRSMTAAKMGRSTEMKTKTALHFLLFLHQSHAGKQVRVGPFSQSFTFKQTLKVWP